MKLPLEGANVDGIRRKSKGTVLSWTISSVQNFIEFRSSVSQILAGHRLKARKIKLPTGGANIHGMRRKSKLRNRPLLTNKQCAKFHRIPSLRFANNGRTPIEGPQNEIANRGRKCWRNSPEIERNRPLLTNKHCAKFHRIPLLRFRNNRRKPNIHMKTCRKWNRH